MSRARCSMARGDMVRRIATELETMIKDGTIVDAQTLAAYLLLKLR